MKEKLCSRGINWGEIFSIIVPLILFWAFLILRLPSSFSAPFHVFSPWIFLIVLVFYSLAFRLQGRTGTFVCLGITFAILALSLSYHWTSGYSDNFIISGLVPYKDGRNYYFGADLILNGHSPINANQATERPLFPSFLASLLAMTGQNLKTTMGILVQLVGIGIYLSARQIRKSYGALAAGLFATLLYFHIQNLIGYVMSGMLGFFMGCLGFTLIWLVARKPILQNLLLGCFVLMVAVSARAGTFFVFPMLAFWGSWVFRGKEKFSWRMTICLIGAILIEYFLTDPLYARLLGIPAGSSFGNFSYALYGQVMGGTGWHRAIEELGTRDPSIVYHEAWKFFLDHPISLLIACVKSYRDFFLIGDSSIFPFGGYSIQNLPGILLWLGTIFLLLWGIFQSTRDIRSNHSSLILAGFIGIILSIPFLPPIDGGSRFYVSTTPFFFVLPAAGIGWISKKVQQNISLEHNWQCDLKIVRIISIIMIILTMLVPFVLRAVKPFSQSWSHIKPQCLPDQVLFIFEMHAGSYVDLIKKGSATRCGFVPNVCFDDFKSNNTEKTTDDFYWELFNLTENNEADTRLIAATDWIETLPHYFFLSRDMLPDNLSEGTFSGCAVEIRTTFQSIFKVETISLISK